MNIAGMAASTIQTAIGDPPLELYITEKAFRPNPVTVRFARTVAVKPGDTVFDIGTGIGPLAITAALAGAALVIAVDPVDMHCELARRNAAKYEVAEIVQVYEGSYFEPFEREETLKDLRANVIVGDVSGIAEPVAHAMGWYSDEVPTGGEDGTDVLIEFLRHAGRYLVPEGDVYFPIAVDLSDSEKVLAAARETFGSVVNAMRRKTTTFPMTEEEVRAVADAYGDNPPPYINLQDRGGKKFWRGQIWRASNPRT